MTNWERANVISSVVSASVAVILMILAIWGLFFTSIPGQMHERYNAEIAESKSEIALMNQEQLELRTSVDLLDKKKDQLLNQNHQYQSELNTTKEELDQLAFQLDSLQERAASRQRLYVQASLRLFERLLTERTRRYFYESELAATYNETLEFIASQPKKGAEGYEEWFMQSSQHVYSHQMGAMLELAIAAGNEDIEPPEYRMVNITTRVEALMERNKERQKFSTGEDLIERLLKTYRNQEPDDYTFELINTFFISAFNEHPILYGSVEPEIYPGATPKQIIKAGERSLATLRKLIELFDDLKAQHE